MCERFDTSGLTWTEIYDSLKTYRHVASDEVSHDWGGEVRPSTCQPAARLGYGGAWVVEPMRWGLVPYWRNGKPLKDTYEGAGDGFRLDTFNASVEGVTTSNTFRAAFEQRRCIVPASGWWTEGQPGTVKHRVSRKDGGIIWFAGLWDRCMATDVGILTSFTVMVGPSRGWLTGHHGRMPIILDPNDWPIWLDPTQNATELLAAARPERFVLS